MFYVQNGHPSKVIKASDVSRTLHVQLLKEKADFLLFKVLRVDTAGMFWIVLAHLGTLQAFGKQHLEAVLEGLVSAIWCLVLDIAFQKMTLKPMLKILVHLWQTCQLLVFF